MEYKPTIIKDTSTGNYHIFFMEGGGPIISASTLKKAKAKFTQAFELSRLVKNLLSPILSWDMSTINFDPTKPIQEI